MPHFRKKPELVEARLFSGLMTLEQVADLARWCDGDFFYDQNEGQEMKTYYWSISLRVVEGISEAHGYGRAAIGDMIIKNEYGGFRVQKAEKFLKYFEEIG